jgi:hypothetical protein
MGRENGHGNVDELASFQSWSHQQDLGHEANVTAPIQQPTSMLDHQPANHAVNVAWDAELEELWTMMVGSDNLHDLLTAW